MKKIVPFNNVLTFDTDVCEITAISLEHEIKTDEDTVSGIFYISGEYKITDGQIEKEKFKFDLPFDIALGSDYDLDTLVVDIDDFRYELVDRNKLKVNIDLYIDGEIIEHPDITIEDNLDSVDTPDSNRENFKKEIENTPNDDTEEVLKEEPVTLDDTDNNLKEEPKEDIIEPTIDRIEITENLDVTKEIDNEENKMDKTTINIDNININDNNNSNEFKNDNESVESDNQEIDIFNGFNEEEKYVTYRVYRVTDGDTIDKIIEKYNTNKEELMKYNNTLDIKPGDKLIIPAND